jgi:ankyrin repeat protein/catechol 2,3-dioxygenase-like lactoylglutathione lyase family enzyme
MPLNLPDRASFEFLKKLAKERLAVLRAGDPAATLAVAQLAIAREYGFSSWRALTAEIDRRRAPNMAAFMEACRAGGVGALRALLTREPALARERVAAGQTGLHLAVSHPDALRVLLEHGADPNARDEGDNAYALHFAAAKGQLDSVRVLLDAGADVHGDGDVHHGGVIGWAARKDNAAVLSLLLAHGARHHIFSAMALGDRQLVERLVADNPECLARRRSRFENGQTPLHAAFAPPDGLGFLAGQPDYEMLALLIELGADLEATDDRGRTPLDVAILRGDDEAINLLAAAGGIRHDPPHTADAQQRITALAESVRGTDPMFRVGDMRATVRWYQSIGFAVLDKYEDGSDLMFAKLGYGRCTFALTPGSDSGPREVSLWIYSDRVAELYAVLKERQFHAAPDGGRESLETLAVPFEEDLYTPFYGGRQFSIRDLNGVMLVYWQPDWLVPAADAAPSP